MARTRKWQTGFEVNSLALEEVVASGLSASLALAIPKTGTRAVRTGSSDNVHHVESATAQCQISLHCQHNGTGAGDEPEIVSLRSGTTDIVRLCWDEDDNQFRVYCGSTLVESAAGGTFSEYDLFSHIGIDVKLDATNGWVYVWRDGINLISYDGETNQGGSSADRIALGSVTALQTWDTYIHFDDIWWDDTAGEVAPAAPADLRFPYLTPNGSGNYSEWLGSDGNQVNNYQLVDETPPNADTDYVEGDAAGEQDSYAMTTYTLAAGESFEAVIPLAVAKKQDALSTLDLKVFTRLSSTDVAGAANVLGTDYRLYFVRQTTPPGGGGWDQAAVDGVEVGVELE